MKPIIKWLGGKTRFLKFINQELKDMDFNNYFEPFFGSGAVFFSLFPNESNREYFINDYNEHLIDFYKWIRDEKSERVHNLISNQLNKFKGLEESEKRSSYLSMKDSYNELSFKNSKKHIWEKSLLFFLINKTSFNGIYRVNSSGVFNVPVGRHKTYAYPTIEELKEVKRVLNLAHINSGEWWEQLSEVKKNDLVYLDPPYYPHETSKFIGYTDPAFGVGDHKDLIKRVKKLVVSKKANVIISNSNSSEFKKLLHYEFDGEKEIEIRYIEIPTRRSINPLAEDKDRFKESLYIIRRKKNG